MRGDRRLFYTERWLVSACMLILGLTVVCGVLQYPESYRAPQRPLPSGPYGMAVATPTPAPAPVPVHDNAPCKYTGALPDHTCTPGLADPTRTMNAICVRNDLAQRPPPEMIERVKGLGMRWYGVDDLDPDDFEWDNLIPTSIGGDPVAAKGDDGRWQFTAGSIYNGWPQPRNSAMPGGRYGYEDKEWLERRLHQEVCDGRITLHDAQVEIAADWLAAALRRGLPAGLPADSVPIPEADDAD